MCNEKYTDYVSFSVFKQVILDWKKKQQKLITDDEETLDAFVACGG